jgi:hypothetical protein
VIETIRGKAIDGSPLPAVNIHWGLDLAVYSFTDVPITLSTQNRR